MADLPSLVDIAQKVGSGGAVLLAYLLYDERKARRACEAALLVQAKAHADALIAMTREAVGAIRDTGNAVEKIAEGAAENRSFAQKVAESLAAIESSLSSIVGRRTGR